MMLNAYNAQGIPFPPTTNSDPAPDIHSAETEKPTPGVAGPPRCPCSLLEASGLPPNLPMG